MKLNQGNAQKQRKRVAITKGLVAEAKTTIASFDQFLVAEKDAIENEDVFEMKLGYLKSLINQIELVNSYKSKNKIIKKNILIFNFRLREWPGETNGVRNRPKNTF